MSLPQWAIDAGADPEMWNAWNHVMLEGGDELLTVRVMAEGYIQLEDDDSSLMGILFPSPAHAIRAAEGLIRALRGDA